MTLIDEVNKLKAECLQNLDKVKTDGKAMSAEDKQEYERKKARISELCDLMREEQSIKAFAVDDVEEVRNAAIKSIATKTPDHKENMEKKTESKASLENLNRYVQGRQDRFAITSSGNSGVVMPKSIPGLSLTRAVGNAYRQAFQALNISPFSFSSTENITLPVFNDVSNSANNDQEGATSGANQDTTYSASVSLNLVEYHSKAQWLSDKVVLAEDFDIVGSGVVPAALSRIERAEDTDWTTLVKAGTTGKTAASTTAITWQEFIAFDESLGAAYAGVPQFIVVSQEMKVALRTMADDQHRPLLDFSQGVYTYNGKPVVVSANLDALTANKTVAAVVAVDGLSGCVIRDCSNNRLIRYQDQPGFPGQIGIEAIGYSAFGFNAASVRLLKTAAS